MPLIDMVFLLLIFFLVATTFAQEEREINIQLPDASLSQPISAPPQQVIINILADGTTKVGGRAYDRPQLRELLTRVVTNEPEREVLIRADERSIHKYFADVASLCRRVGINEVKIGYILEQPEPVAVR
jgi:biopolymer transport protein ExbD